MRTFAQTSVRTVLSLIIGLGAAGSALAQSYSPDDAHRMGTMKPAAGQPSSTTEFKAADATMMRDMAVPYSGDPDVDFRTHMIPHHEGAVAMAKVALSHARDPATKSLAQAIIADQEREISDMRAWLKSHGR